MKVMRKNTLEITKLTSMDAFNSTTIMEFMLISNIKLTWSSAACIITLMRARVFVSTIMMYSDFMTTLFRAKKSTILYRTIKWAFMISIPTSMISLMSISLNTFISILFTIICNFTWKLTYMSSFTITVIQMIKKLYTQSRTFKTCFPTFSWFLYIGVYNLFHL